MFNTLMKSNTKKQIYKSNIDPQKITKQEFKVELSYFTLFFEYLNKNYKNFYLSKYCLTFNNNTYLGYMKYNPLDIVPSKLDFEKLPSKIKEEFNDNKTKRFVVYPMILSNGNSFHQNSIIIDTKKMEVEIFEPYGDLIEKIKNDNKLKLNNNVIFERETYHNLIKKFSQTLTNNKKIKLFPPTSFLPKTGLQQIEEASCKKENYLVNTPIGFCVAWTMWFIEMRIKYPDKPRNYFINKIINHVNKGETEDYVCLLIRNYSAFLNKLYSNLPLHKRIHFNIQHKFKHYLLKTFQNLILVSLGYAYFVLN